MKDEMLDRIWSILGISATLSAVLLTSCRAPTQEMPTGTPYSELNIVLLDGSGHRVLANAGYTWGAMPTDSCVVFKQNNFELYRVNYDGSNLTRLYPNIQWGECQLSPNRDKILLTSYAYEAGGNTDELYLINPDGTNLTKLGPSKSEYIWPNIAPDLDEIVFVRNGMATIAPDGSGFVYRTPNTDSSRCLYALYVDKNNIAYLETVNSRDWIRLYSKTSLEDQLIVRFTSGGLPPFSKAQYGSNLVFADRDSIKTVDVFTLKVQNISRGWQPSYSSDGSRIVATEDKVVYVMDSNGANQHIVYTELDPNKHVEFPRLSPDNKYIVFQIMWTVY